MEYQLQTPICGAIEKQVHANFANLHEWVNASLEEIVTYIVKANEEGVSAQGEALE